MKQYHNVVKFDNRDKLPIRNKNDIQIRFDHHKQILKNVLYISNIEMNLLFIRILNRREFIINFDERIINIINKRNNDVMTRDHIKNDFYELTKCFFNKTFTSLTSKTQKKTIIKKLSKKMYDINQTLKIFHKILKMMR